MKAIVHVGLKPGVLDPQGKAVADSLGRMGFNEVSGARIGKVMKVDIPRPRSRKALLEHPDYYRYREEVLQFLEDYEGGANPPPPSEDVDPELEAVVEQALAATEEAA